MSPSQCPLRCCASVAALASAQSQPSGQRYAFQQNPSGGFSLILLGPGVYAAPHSFPDEEPGLRSFLPPAARSHWLKVPWGWGAGGGYLPKASPRGAMGSAAGREDIPKEVCGAQKQEDGMGWSRSNLLHQRWLSE